MGLFSSEDQQVTRCPLCGLETKRTKCRLLNNFEVCRKCQLRFCNRRETAYIIDLVVYFFLARYAEYGILRVFGRAPASIMGWILWGSFPLKDGFRGMSPGKWLCDLQVVDCLTLRPTGFVASFKRNLLTLIPVLGALLIALRLRVGRRWGDGWANTMVVWRKHAHKAPFDRYGTCCEGCGYDLTGNVSNVCPECGTPISDRIRERISRGEPSADGTINSESS